MLHRAVNERRPTERITDFGEVLRQREETKR